MYCPICRNPLIESEDKKFETLCDHIENPNIPISERPNRPTWQCKHKVCNLYKNGFWDENGAYYSCQLLNQYEELKKEAFQNDLSALNSFERRLQIEIYKHDEDKYFNFHFFQIKLEYKYIADEWGKILKRKIQPKLLIKDGNSYIYHVFGIRMLKFAIEEFYKAKRRFYLENNQWTRKQLRYHLEKSTWDKRWWRIVGTFIVKLFNRKFLKEYDII